MKADPKTREEILAALGEFDRVFRQRDLSGVMSIFADDGVIFLGSETGATAKGTNELRSFFESLFTEPIAYGFRWEHVDVQAVGEVAWFFADCHIQTISAAGQHEHPYRVTGVFRRIAGHWRWVHYHGSEPAG